MCPQGTYSDKEGVEQCRKCPVGTYSDELGRTMCKSCPPGTFQVQSTIFQENFALITKLILQLAYTGDMGVTGKISEFEFTRNIKSYINYELKKESTFS